MQQRVVTQEEFVVIGIAGRTNNAVEKTGAGLIPKLWQRFSEEDLFNTITNAAGGEIDPRIFCVYTDYESDKDGEYTVLIGLKVPDETIAPSGMVAKSVPAGRYAVFTSERGQVWEIVPKIWYTIWASSAQQLGGDRAYCADFEIYDQRAANPADAQIDVYIGIK